MSADLRRAGAAQLRSGYRAGHFTATEVVEQLLAAVAREDAILGAWLHLRGDEVRREAAAVVQAEPVVATENGTDSGEFNGWIPIDTAAAAPDGLFG